MKNLENDAFSKCHPAVGFLFFIGAIGLGALIMHPLYILVSVIGGASYYCLLHGARAKKMIYFTVPVFIVLSAINPLINRDGEHVLAHVLGGPYTLEALIYGMVISGILVEMILWSGCYNAVMTSDKFMSLFGKMIPSISMMLLMVLRLIPNMIRKTKQISGARKCIGKGSAENSTRRERIEDSLNVISALMTWALEGGIITADAMRSRGYGSGERSTFQIFQLKKRDLFILIYMILLIGTVVFLIARGGTAADYTPVMSITPVTGNRLYGFIAYILFVMIPTVLYIKEAVLWRISRSGI